VHALHTMAVEAGENAANAIGVHLVRKEIGLAHQLRGLPGLQRCVAGGGSGLLRGDTRGMGQRYAGNKDGRGQQRETTALHKSFLSGVVSRGMGPRVPAVTGTPRWGVGRHIESQDVALSWWSGVFTTRKKKSLFPE